MKLIVMLPAYNEERTISEVIEATPREIEGVDEVKILVMNDGSTDGTVEVAKKAGADRVVTSKERRGLSKTFKRGLETALEMSADIIVNIDADNQYDAGEIPKLIRPILKNEADIVLGSRFKGHIEYMPTKKKIGNKTATFVTNLLSGLSLSDAQTGYRAFSREAALRLSILSKYTYTQETIIQAAHKKLKIIEVPIVFRRRAHGRSRLISGIFNYAKNAGVTILTTYLNYRPLKTFLFIGGFIILIGLFTGFRVLLHYLKTGLVSPYLPSAVLTAILLIVGFQAIMVGLFAEMIKSNRELIEDILLKLRKER